MIESNLDVGGAVVFWTAAEFTDRSRLLTGLTALGLAHFVPEPRPAASILRDALDEVLGGSRILVRPLADRDGFTVVREDRGRASNLYSTVLTARVTDGDPPRLTFDPDDHRADQVRTSFRRHGERIPGPQLSACLVRVVEALGGTRLRPTGAVYWIPGPRIDDWADVAGAVEQAADGKPSAVYVLRHRLDGDAVRAVRDAVVGEVRGEARRIGEAVLGGDLGGRALESRKKQAGELRDKVLLYEHLLSVGLSDLHAELDRVDQAAASATLLLGAGVPA